MAEELYVLSLSKGKKVWMGVGDGECDIKPKVEVKSKSMCSAQEHHRSAIDNAHQSLIPPPNALINRPLHSISVPLATSLPIPPASYAVPMVTEGQGTMNRGNSTAMVDKEKTVSDAANALQKLKERESLKDELLETKNVVIAMLKENAVLKEKNGDLELETKLKQKEETIATMEKRGAGVGSLESAVQTDPTENDKETEQRHRAAIAAQKLGLPLSILEPPNEWKEKFEKLERLYQAEQKTTATLREKLMNLGKDAKKEVMEGEPIEVDNNEESNEMVTSPPVADHHQIGAASKQKCQKNLVNVRIAVVSGRRMIVRHNRRLPAVASAGGQKQSVTANPINVANGTFPCVQCPEHLHFASAQLLQEHQRRRHSTRHRLPCDQCDRTFTLLCNLNRHMKQVHSGLKPFACSSCDKSFTIKADLKKHERTHSGERPFVCAVCQKAFRESSHLRVHERAHTGEKPYCCKYCGRKFLGSSDCWQHQKSCSKRAE